MVIHTQPNSSIKKLLASLAFILPLTIVFGQTAFVSGNIKTWCDPSSNVEGVTVLATDSSGDITVAITDGAGNYILELDTGDDYLVAPFSNDVPLNGVSTFDFVIMNQHLLGTNVLTDPFALVAADVNNSGTIDLMDLLDIRTLILGFAANFPNNTSWRFFNADMEEVSTLQNLTGNVSGLDWTAVKIGDLNCSSFLNTEPSSTYLSVIQGKVFEDENLDCSDDGTEPALQGWDITASSSTASFIGRSKADGTYLIMVPTGTYDISITPPNPYWSSCTLTYEDEEITFPSTSEFNFGAEKLADCEWMTVQLAAPFLRRCFENSYYIQYCNQGTQDASNVEVVLEFDDFFENFSSSIPWSSANGNIYSFEIGTVAAGECGNFTVDFDISCDAEIGQAHCTSAHIYPDTTCLPANPLWSGADLDVSGECIGDEIIFTLTNNGENMTESVDFVVIEDVMIQMPNGQSSVLESGQSEQIPLPAPTANGSTWRIMVNEVKGHPFDLLNTVAIEGCGGFSPGFVTQYPTGDEEHYLDVDCQQNIGSWDPNDKQGFPLGVGEDHFIEKGQDIEYLIRFQNTGTDTAFTVSISDTLDSNLDWSSVEVGPSSHPYQFSIYDRGVMVFTFENIMLPDSNVNEPGSHGFVKFMVKQKPGLEIGERIENQAAIFFDFNEPVITNRTLHTLGENYIEVSSTETFVSNLRLDVYPNPFESITTFRLEGVEVQHGTLSIYDQMGRQVHHQKIDGSHFQFDGSKLQKGLYYFKIHSGHNEIAAGKILK